MRPTAAQRDVQRERQHVGWLVDAVSRAIGAGHACTRRRSSLLVRDPESEVRLVENDEHFS
jgi:hypothetical protein